MSFEAVMLSYDEPLADVLHTRLTEVLGSPVKRLHGVRGMRRAYQLCAELVDAESFFLADGDFSVYPEFPADRVKPLADDVSMRVWSTVNAVNGLVYGYGGLKLIRRSALREMGEAVDVLAALPGRCEFRPETAGTTLFNQSAYHAWKAGFRECAMLAHGSEYGMSSTDTRARLDAWTASHDGDFAADAAAGARAGIAFAQCTPGADQLEVLNNPDWLRARFDAGDREAGE